PITTPASTTVSSLETLFVLSLAASLLSSSGLSSPHPDIITLPLTPDLITLLQQELKQDLSLDTFCLKSFDATDAAFRIGCVLYNLLADFRETILPRSWFERWLRAVRDFVFVAGADLITPKGAESRSVLPCLSPTAQSSCVACALCRTGCRLRRS